mmetsp:Transcript_34799/g.108420  ORF Transcript_34799/g.108420 Transcript_34799/m.108420 type:complete len:302 (+) Transcript_34799:3-908(+)
MLNIFRTKPCQRLARDGVCRWRSQCQYSHCPEWPRRQPRKYVYSPEVCPHLRSGTGCRAGLNCPKAHSKEEVLFHPHFFKTSLCKEHAHHAVQRGSRNARGSKRHRCHRYYCPFAHGAEELRVSPLTEEQRESCVQALELFPSDDCCMACTRYWITPYSRVEERCTPVLDLEAHLPFPPWPQPPQSAAPQRALPAPPLWGLPATAPGPQQSQLQQEQWHEGVQDSKGLPEFQPPSPGKPVFLSSLGTGAREEESAEAWSDMMPAFIDLAEDGTASVAPLKLRASSVARQRELLGEVVYAML